MSIELVCLVWSTALCLAYISAQVMTKRLQEGVGNYDPNNDRDIELGLRPARAERALRNFLETYPIFIALVAAAQLSGSGDWLTQWGAVLYLVARVIYLPLYIFGIGPMRSLVWTLAFIGLVMIFVGVLI